MADKQRSSIENRQKSIEFGFDTIQRRKGVVLSMTPEIGLVKIHVCRVKKDNKDEIWAKCSLM